MLLLVVRRHRPAFAGRHLLVRIERERRRMPMRAERSSLVPVQGTTARSHGHQQRSASPNKQMTTGEGGAVETNDEERHGLLLAQPGTAGTSSWLMHGRLTSTTASTTSGRARHRPGRAAGRTPVCPRGGSRRRYAGAARRLNVEPPLADDADRGSCPVKTPQEHQTATTSCGMGRTRASRRPATCIDPPSCVRARALGFARECSRLGDCSARTMALRSTRDWPKTTGARRRSAACCRR